MLTSLKSPLSKQPASRCASTATKFQNINNNNNNNDNNDNKDCSRRCKQTQLLLFDSNTGYSSFRGPWHNWWYWRRSGPVATKRLRGHGMPTISSCMLGVMRLDTLFQMQLPMQAQSEAGKNPLAQTHTANSVGDASVKHRGLVHGLTTVRTTYRLSTK
jgi:hypothetical protein